MDFFGVEVRALFEDQDLGMVIERKRFFSVLIVDLEVAEFGEGLKDRHEFKAQPAFMISRLGFVEQGMIS